MSLHRAFACVVIVLVLAVAHSAAAASYSVVDLGILPSISSSLQSYDSSGLGISETGQATGTSDVYVSNVSYRHGFYWNNGTLTDMDASNPSENTFVNGMSPDGNAVGARQWIRLLLDTGQRIHQPSAVGRRQRQCVRDEHAGRCRR